MSDAQQPYDAVQTGPAYERNAAVMFFDRVRRSPDRTAVALLHGPSQTYAELGERLAATVRRLRRHGVGPGDRVAYAGANSAELIEHLVAAWAQVAATARRHGRDPAALGLQGRIDIHGPLDADRLRRGLDGWRAAGATHVSVHGTGQGRGAEPHVGFVAAVASIAEGVPA